ncbi:MAG: nuclear transport factor 2 family protein [Actinobacteria bacterium]|nr:MAG: nuclear transport factor 2 family protein [Actinomycetota bacterium]
MSEQNVERYVRGVEAWNRGELDEWLERTGEEPGWELVTGGAFPGLAPVYRGREGAVELWDALRGAWDERGLHIVIERIEDLGETVLALLTMQASGQSSGVPVAIKWAHVITFENGEQQIRSYASWDQALTAVGLEG